MENVGGRDTTNPPETEVPGGFSSLFYFLLPRCFYVGSH